MWTRATQVSEPHFTKLVTTDGWLVHSYFWGTRQTQMQRMRQDAGLCISLLSECTSTLSSFFCKQAPWILQTI